MFRQCTTLTAVLIACQSVISYESVYDIIGRQNQRRIISDHLNGYPESRQTYFDSHPVLNGRSDSSRQPFRFDRFGYQGNGYDNIGNGNIRARDRLHYFPEVGPHQRYRGGFDHIYRREFPVFYNKYYYIRPKDDLRSFDYDKRKNGGAYEEKDNSNVYKSDSVVANNEGSNQKNLLENFRDKKLSTVSDARRKENFGESSHNDKSNENKYTIRNNRISKKGHITKGFSTHHHKDETGNTTTFYDEFSDHGGQDDYRDVADGFRTKTTSDVLTSLDDGNLFNEYGGQSGNYETGSMADTRKYENNYILNDNRVDRGDRYHLEGRKHFLGSIKNLLEDRYAPDQFYLSPYNY